LEALYTDKWRQDFQPLRLKIQSVPKGGLTGHIAHRGKVVRLLGTELSSHPYGAGATPDYLASGECFSLLGIPLKDRKGRLLGLVRADNKKSADGKPNEITFFDGVDESIAKILANKIVVVLENLRLTETLRGLLEAVHSAQDLNEILKMILQKTLTSLHADRGDFFLWSESQRDLIVGASHGERTYQVGQAAPDPSIVRTIWNIKDQNFSSPETFCPNLITMRSIPGLEAK